MAPHHYTVLTEREVDTPLRLDLGSPTVGIGLDTANVFLEILAGRKLVTFFKDEDSETGRMVSSQGSVVLSRPPRFAEQGKRTPHEACSYRCGIRT